MTGKGLGGFIKGIFVDTSEDDNQTEVVNTKNTPSIKVQPNTTQVAPSVQPQTEINKDIVASLKKTLEDANLEGYDYYEFVKAIETIDMPSEEQKFKVAFSVIVNLPGMSVAHLIKTADHYTEALAQHKKDFAIKFDQAVKANIADLETEISAADAEIDTIQKRMTVLTEKRTNLNNTVQYNRIEIERQKTDYNLAYGIFESNIIENKKKIERYLKEK